MIPIKSGMIAAETWCHSEVARMMAKGLNVQVVQRGGLVWIQRCGNELKGNQWEA